MQKSGGHADKKKQGVGKKNMTRSRRDMHTTGGATKIRGPSSWQEGKQKQRMHARSGVHANKNAEGQLPATRKMERVYDKWSECRNEWSEHSNQ